MAGFEKDLNRRQQRRQLKQQPVSGRREVAKTQTAQFRPNLPKPAGLRQWLTTATRRQQEQFQNQSGLNWWQQLVGQSDTQPPPTKKRGDSQSLPTKKRTEKSTLPKRQRDNSSSRQPSKKDKKTRQQDEAHSVAEQASAVPPSSPQKPRNRRPNRIAVTSPRFEQMPTARTRLKPKGKQQPLGGVSRTPAQHSKSRANRVSRRPSDDLPETSNRVEGTAGKKNQASSIPPSKPSVSPRSKLHRRGFAPLIYGARLLILGIGLGVMVGTMLSISDPANRDRSSIAESNKPSQVKTAVAETSPPTTLTAFDDLTSLKLTEEIKPLKTAIADLLKQYPELKPEVFIVELDTGAYVDWKGSATLAAASTIKIPLLVAFFQDVDTGKIRLDELLTMQSEHIATGSGQMQYQQPGTKYTALDVVTKMITISDNTATNMLIARLGGQEALNQRFLDWGLTATAIGNKLPDVEGTNTTSPKDLATLIAQVNQGELVSLSSRDRLFNIMRRTERNHLLPRGLGEGASIAHKTGNIGSMVADAGLIDLPSGKRYIAAVMVKRPRNDLQAEKLIRQISNLAYQYFSNPIVSPKIRTGDPAAPNNSIVSPTEPAEPRGNTSSAMAGRQPRD